MVSFDAESLARKLAPPVREARGRAGFVLRRLFRGIGAKKQEQFYFQLSTMLSAGVAIRSALHTLADQHTGRAARVFGEMAEEVQAGGQLFPVMMRRPEVFGHFAPAMVKAAEQTGGLDVNLALVARTLERFRRIRSQVITALLYPALLLHLAVFIWNAPVLFIGGGPGPYVERVLTIIVPIYLAAAVLWFVHEIVRDSHWFGELVLSLFLFGGVSRKTGLARYARTLSALYESGVPLPHAAEISADIPSNAALRTSLREAVPNLMSGASLAESIAACRHVTPMVRNMVNTGEQSGRLGVALEKIAGFYEDEAETAIKRLAVVIPLFIYLVIIGGIAWNIISFYMGYFSGLPRM